MLPEVRLVKVNREDAERMAEWLHDEDVNASWYGTNEQGEPLHIGYSLSSVLLATDREREKVFGSEVGRIFSVLTSEGEHIGEAEMVIEAPLSQAHLFVLIGRKDLWYRGYGTAAMLALLDMAFYEHRIHRAWVDIPEYNLPAIHMCERFGFILEGRRRRTHPKDGERHDSLVMGLILDEYVQRRARLMELTQAQVAV